MTQLTNEQIDEACLQVLTYLETYEPNLYTMHYIMYNFGCRETETVELNRWSYKNSSTLQLQTMKRGGLRYFTIDEIPDLFEDYINTPPDRGFLYSSRNLRKSFDKFSPYASIICKRKDISCHLYRHNKMKKLYSDGMSYEAIAEYFAVSDAYVAQYYVESEIFVP